MHESHRQADYQLRFDWGPLGARAITPVAASSACRYGTAVRSPTGSSPSAASWHAVADRLKHSLYECASGRELIQKVYRQDVVIAAELDASSGVPVLVGSRFVAMQETRDAG